MKKLGGLALLLLLVAGVWVNSLRPAPNVKARSYENSAVDQKFDWAEIFPNSPDHQGSFMFYGGLSSHNMHFPRDLVVFLPSAGREASDFIELSKVIESNGHSVESIDFPSLKRNKAPKNLEEYTKIFSPSILAGDEKVILVGHAYGNRGCKTDSHTSTQSSEFRHPPRGWWASPA